MHIIMYTLFLVLGYFGRKYSDAKLKNSDKSTTHGTRYKTGISYNKNTIIIFVE